MFYQFTTARIKMDVETFGGNKHDYIWKFVPVETCYGLVDNFSTEERVYKYKSKFMGRIFINFELNEIMRQTIVLEFAKLLNRVREGNQLVPQNIQTPQSR